MVVRCGSVTRSMLCNISRSSRIGRKPPSWVGPSQLQAATRNVLERCRRALEKHPVQAEQRQDKRLLIGIDRCVAFEDAKVAQVATR